MLKVVLRHVISRMINLSIYLFAFIYKYGRNGSVMVILMNKVWTFQKMNWLAIEFYKLRNYGNLFSFLNSYYIKSCLLSWILTFDISCVTKYGILQIIVFCLWKWLWKSKKRRMQIVNKLGMFDRKTLQSIFSC